LVVESSTTFDDNYLKTCIDALADSDYHVVISVSGNSYRDVLNTLPANIEINDRAYNIDILPHAALTICQAGMGITLESLYCGVPVLAVPRSPFHAEVAYRVTELGVGTCIPPGSVTNSAIKDSAARILGDTALLDRAKAMREIFRNSTGEKNAADRIERFLGA